MTIEEYKNLQEVYGELQAVFSDACSEKLLNQELVNFGSSFFKLKEQGFLICFASVNQDLNPNLIKTIIQSGLEQYNND